MAVYCASHNILAAFGGGPWTDRIVNEEEIKIKYVLPWLEQAGIDLSELQLERTFSVRLGKQLIPASRSSEVATGRLDILVRHGEKNLFIVETKAGHLALPDTDRDQAISYARLVHPVAPYAVVTNGSEYRLYDSLSKARIEPATIRIKGFEAVLPDADIAEAQRIFLNLNPANLVAFCQSQVNGEIQSVKGTVSDGKKYDPALHVPRAAVLKEVEKFYKGSVPGLILVGESGSGKTCELCSVVESLMRNGKPVLFFNGFSLDGDLLDAVAREFLWTFNGGGLPIEVVKRIEAYIGDSFLTIVIDAIDEWRFESKVNHLASILKAVEHRKIKLLASCKSSAVEHFLFQRGNKTAIDSLTARVTLPAFSSPEFFEAIEKYREAYQFYGGFEDLVLNQARENPFLLRVLFDVAQNSNAKHLTFSSSEFFAEYYERSVGKTIDAQLAGRTLKGVARLLYESNKDWIPEDSLRDALGLTVNDKLMEELFEFGILVRSSEGAGESVVSFYFQQFRDYIIGFKVLQLNKRDGAYLILESKHVIFPSVRGAVFLLYYRLASLEHKQVFDSELRQSASKYLASYISLIQKNFPLLARAFMPKGNCRIGFVGEFLLPQRRIGMHGFRALSEGEEEVHFVPVEQLADRSNLTFLAGAERLHLMGDGWDARDESGIEAAVREHELMRQVSEFVTEGRLNESSNPEMNCEHIVQVISRNKDVFNSLLESGRRNVRYPIQLDSIIECILKKKLNREFQDEIIQRKRKSGEIVDSWDGDFVSYSSSLNSDEEEAVAKRVDEAFNKGEKPSGKVRYVGLEKIEIEILDAVKELRKSCDVIAVDPPFVKVYSDVFNRVSIPRDDLVIHLRDLYASFLSNYQILVEKNFPTLKSEFNLYSRMPVAVFLVIGAGFDRARGYGSMGLTIYCARSQGGANTVEVVKEVAVNECDGRFCFTVSDVEYEGISWVQTSVGGVFAGFPVQVSDSFRGMSLRGLVYSMIKKELPAVKAFFLSERASESGTR